MKTVDVYTSRPPCLVVVGCGDCAADAGFLADGPDLLEIGGALDRSRVDTLGPVHRIYGSVAGVVSDERDPIAWIVDAIVFKNIVLGKRVGEPSVDGQEATTVRLVGAAVVDCTR